MRLPFRQLWQLRDIERGLRLSDPRMAAMFAVFARLNAREAIASREQARRRAGPFGWILVALAAVASGLAAAAHWLFRIAARSGAAARRPFRRAAAISTDQMEGPPPVTPAPPRRPESA